jgi:hypothetical protein
MFPHDRGDLRIAVFAFGTAFVGVAGGVVLWLCLARVREALADA